jgi:hypothetical protein
MDKIIAWTLQPVWRRKPENGGSKKGLKAIFSGQ